MARRAKGQWELKTTCARGTQVSRFYDTEEAARRQAKTSQGQKNIKAANVRKKA